MDGIVCARVMEQGEVKNMEPPESLKRLLVELGRCIERLLSSSEEVGELLKKMEREGYHVHVGFVTMVRKSGGEEPLRFALNDWDREFLEETGIAFGDPDGGDCD